MDKIYTIPVEDKHRKNDRARASSRAKSRLLKLHYKQYESLYREECARLGLNNRPTRAERIARLHEEIEAILETQEREEGEDEQ